MNSRPQHKFILRMRVDATSYEHTARRIVNWARSRESRYVCLANVHMVMESYDDPAFRRIVNDADLVTPDGMPLVWCLRLLGISRATRVCGPELTPFVCARAAEERIPVGFYGGHPQVLDRLANNLQKRFPNLDIAYSWSPPFRPLAHAEDNLAVQMINESGARILFVGLGCPKQERWMNEHKGVVQAVMLGVGAAFDFVAGTKRQAPKFVRQAGLEWLFRLLTEPRRLWRRYLLHNPRFLALFAYQLLTNRSAKRTRESR